MPRGSFSSAQPSSPVHGGPTQFSPWGERYRGVAASDRSEGKLRLSCVVPYEPPVISAACLHPRSSCVCWGRHRHHRRHDLASCLRNRLHHLYLGRRPPCTASAASTSTAAGRWLLLWLAPAGASCTTRGLLGCFGLRLPAQCLPLQRCLRPRRFWALGPAVRAFSGSW